MSEMNLITKKIIAEKILTAIMNTGVMQIEAARQLDINPSNLSFLKDENKLKDISNNVWEKLRKWVNEGKKFAVYPVGPEKVSSSKITEKEQKALDKLKPVEVPPEQHTMQGPVRSDYSGTLLPGEDEIRVKVRPEAARKRASELNVSAEVNQLKKKMTIVADQSKLPEYIAQLIKDKLFSNMVDSVELVVNLK